jgi:hypothetical protein
MIGSWGLFESGNKEGQSTQGDIETELANVGWISFSDMEEAASTILSMPADTLYYIFQC